MLDRLQRLEVRTSYRQRYREYVQSPHWKALRWEAITQAGRRCQCCGHNRRLEAHHMNYRNLTDCTVADLVVLCSRCHDYFHEALRINNTKPHMYDLQGTVQLIHNYCRQQHIPLVGPVNEKPVRKMVMSAYNKCKGRQYCRAAIEALVIDLKAILATIDVKVDILPLRKTPFQRHVLSRIKKGVAFVSSHCTPEQRDELQALLLAGELRLIRDGIYVEPTPPTP